MLLFCPICREPDVTVTVSIADPNTFHCTACDDDFTRTDVAELQEQVARWNRVLAWADQCPRDTPATV